MGSHAVKSIFSNSALRYLIHSNRTAVAENKIQKLRNGLANF